MIRKRILSLDGGGSWAILQAMALKEIYKDTPVTTNCGKILEQFDVISANSGGSLMLAAMLLHKDDDIDRVIEMFDTADIRKAVFSNLSWMERKGVLGKFTGMFFRSFSPKYKTSRKRTGLIKALGNFGEEPFFGLNRKDGFEKIAENIVICGFDFDRNRAYFFRTNDSSPSSDSPVHYTYTVADVVNASSNAPVMFFDEPVEFELMKDREHRFWDGAIGGNNNPVLVGLTEALAVYKNQSLGINQFDVLSIGTGNNFLPLAENHSYPAEDSKLKITMSSSFLTVDIKKLASSIISEPPDAANYIAHMMMGGDPHSGAEPKLVRLNALIQPQLKDNKWIIPEGINREDRQSFLDLIEMQMDAVEKEEVDRIKKLGEWWINGITVNQPIRARGKDLSCSIGHSTFQAGKEAWLKKCGL